MYPWFWLRFGEQNIVVHVLLMLFGESNWLGWIWKLSWCCFGNAVFIIYDKYSNLTESPLLMKEFAPAHLQFINSNRLNTRSACRHHSSFHHKHDGACRGSMREQTLNSPNSLPYGHLQHDRNMLIKSVRTHIPHWPTVGYEITKFMMWLTRTRVHLNVCLCVGGWRIKVCTIDGRSLVLLK